MESAGHSRHQLQRPGGQHGDLGRDQVFFLHVAPAEPWKLQKILTSKKGSLRQMASSRGQCRFLVISQSYMTFEEAGANLEVEIVES